MVINTLANNAFKYWIILSDKIVLSTILFPYVFNLLIDFQYNNIKFKELLIDLGASTLSTGGIG